MLFEVVIEKMNLQPQNRVQALQGIIDIHNARLLNNFAVYRYLRRRQPRGVRRRKQFWMTNFLVERERYGHYDNLMVDLLENDCYGYKISLDCPLSCFMNSLKGSNPVLRSS